MGVAWPATGEELRAAGYKATAWGECKSCGTRIAWALTSAGKRMPLEVVGDGEPKRFQAHFTSCSYTKKKQRIQHRSAAIDAALEGGDGDEDGDDLVRESLSRDGKLAALGTIRRLFHGSYETLL